MLNNEIPNVQEHILDIALINSVAQASCSEAGNTLAVAPSDQTNFSSEIRSEIEQNLLRDSTLNLTTEDVSSIVETTTLEKKVEHQLLFRNTAAELQSINETTILEKCQSKEIVPSPNNNTSDLSIIHAGLANNDLNLLSDQDSEFQLLFDPEGNEKLSSTIISELSNTDFQITARKHVAEDLEKNNLSTISITEIEVSTHVTLHLGIRKKTQYYHYRALY